MKPILRWIILVVISVLLTACGQGSISIIGPTETSNKPTAVVEVTPPPNTEAAMQAFLDAWKADDYASMYNMLSESSRAKISQDDFTKRYNDALNEMSLKELETHILSTLTNPTAAQVAFRVIYHTYLVGDIQRDMIAYFTREDNAWKLVWDANLILPELGGGNRLSMDYKIPARGDIYDRNGNAVVTQNDVIALGVQPGQINPDSEGILLNELSKLTGKSPLAILASYQYAQPDWYIAVGEVPADIFNHRYTYYTSLGGLVWNEYTGRYYADGGVAPQVVGYVTSIQKDEYNQYRRLGYRGDEKVGRNGIEKWGEDILAGKHGGSLYVVDSNNNIVTRLGQSDPQPAQNIYLTLDKKLQEQAQQAISGFNGAVVVLERDTGRVLAMASSPGFDPNVFDPNNYNNGQVNDLLNDTNRPLYNRATQGTYPLGSVFKVVTFSAALESGVFAPDSTYDCQYDFTELTDRVLHDWTYDHCQRELATTGVCRTQPSGILTLKEGLMRSCNPWFWHIGLSLFQSGRTTAVADMARAFGLSKATGIDQVAENDGQILNPGSDLDATNQAIGQGDVQVTPLQVATIMAAIGNGGTLYRPQIVEKIVDVNGDATAAFKPVSNGILPLKPENLQTLRGAMWDVVHNPRGTAYFRLYSLTVPVYGKTGTAESGVPGSPHAWFAGFTDANASTGLPDLAIAVIAEYAGEGSDYAAPIFKRVVESYYLGQPQSLYWWESSIGVTRTPTPYGTLPTTPTPTKAKKKP
jgi:penicillin-binding protein 2